MNLGIVMKIQYTFIHISFKLKHYELGQSTFLFARNTNFIGVILIQNSIYHVKHIILRSHFQTQTI